MYDATDPRSALATAPAPVASDEGVADFQSLEFDREQPTEVSAAGSPTWYYRGQNFVMAYTRLKAGDSLVRRGQLHEYVTLLMDLSTEVGVETGDTSRSITERAIVVVPPGDSSVTAAVDTAVVRLFDHRSEDVLGLASNRDTYAAPHPRVAPLVPWPAPVGGDRLRVYPIDRIPEQPGRFGRIFRTSAFMVNVLDLQEGPRDPDKLSPHHHDDFEQCSLAVEGRYVHHVRTPWTPRRSQWREDVHESVGSPSVAIIPPPTVHTSEAVGAGRNQLVDIFCPPRVDFSLKEGWVLNAVEYPMPEAVDG